MPPVFVVCEIQMEDKETESCIVGMGAYCVFMNCWGSLMIKLDAFIPCLGGLDFLVEDNLQHWENGLQLANSSFKRQ